MPLPEKISFGRALSDYVSGLDSLREFISLVGGFLDTKSDEFVKRRAKDLAPMLVAMAKMKTPGFENVKLTEEQLKTIFDGEINLEVSKGDDGQESIKLNMRGPGEQSFSEAIKEFKGNTARFELLYRSGLISLIGSIELLFSQLLQLYFRKAPNALDNKEKAFSFEELSQFKTLDDARESIIDSRVENILRSGFSEWVSFLRKYPKIKLGYITNKEEALIECFQRRHLFIHNGGLVNNQYLSKCAEALTKDLKIGEQLTIGRDYVITALENFEVIGILILRELWSKLHPDETKRQSAFGNLIFEKLKEQRWAFCEAVSLHCLEDETSSEQYRLVAELNYYLSIKRQGRWGSIKDKVEGLDYSAKGLRFQLGLLSLCEKKKEFFSTLEKTLKAKQIDLSEFESFPIFKEMRETPEGVKTLKKIRPPTSKQRPKKADPSTTKQVDQS